MFELFVFNSVSTGFHKLEGEMYNVKMSAVCDGFSLW